jgi:hypothetical protein
MDYGLAAIMLVVIIAAMVKLVSIVYFWIVSLD